MRGAQPLAERDRVLDHAVPGLWTLARTHRVWLAGSHPGHLPMPHDGALALHVVIPIVFRLVFHRLLSVDTPMGRKAKPNFLQHSGPLIRVRPKALAAAGVQRAPKVAGVRDGQPLLEDGRSLTVDNVVWCTGYRPGLQWLQLPVFDETGRPRQYRGASTDVPGLYFAGLSFQHSPSSTMVHGAARDARWVVAEIVQRVRAPASCSPLGRGAIAEAPKARCEVRVGDQEPAMRNCAR